MLKAKTVVYSESISDVEVSVSVNQDSLICRVTTDNRTGSSVNVIDDYLDLGKIELWYATTAKACAKILARATENDEFINIALQMTAKLHGYAMEDKVIESPSLTGCHVRELD